MLRILPIGPDEWGYVTGEHTLVHPGRDIESSKRKYTIMHRKKSPTGDPNISEEVRLAKEVINKIGAKSSVARGDKYYILLNRFVADNELDEKEPALAVGADSINIPGEKCN